MAKLSLVAILLSACGLSSVVGSNAQSNQDELLGGYAAVGKGLDAVGSLGVLLDGAYHGNLCTATLVGPSTVLSAGHCGDKVFGTYDLYFAPGSENANTPKMKYQLVAGSRLAHQDMFVFHTAVAVAGVTPIAVANPLSADNYGQRFVAIGADRTSGLRKMGAITVNALGGYFFERLFGSYDAFLDNLSELGLDVPSCQAEPKCAKNISDMWTTALRDTEAFAGLQPGDVQVCNSDSGGPLLRTVTHADGSRERETFGVLSDGWLTADDDCYGAFYATFDAATLAVLDKELSWTDPCGATPVSGECNGSVVTRCTGVGEGPRRISSYDCADVGQACVTLASGNAGCDDEKAPMVSDALTAAQLASMMQAALRGGETADRLRSFTSAK